MSTDTQGPGLSGVLRLTWVTDQLEHVLQHSGADEPVGIWTGLACPAHGLAIGSDVDDATLRYMARGEIADLVWEPSTGFGEDHGHLCRAAIRSYQVGDQERGEQLWQQARILWTRGRAANDEALALMQQSGITRFSARKPQRWVIASYAHHCGPHGVGHPHVHNIVIPALTTGVA